MRTVRLMALICAATITCAAEPAGIIDHGGLPHRVHVFEDYETDIEKRWWLRGVPETSAVTPSLSEAVPNRRACRANKTKDFDDKLGDQTKSWKEVVFNPVPGPPMGANTRLRFTGWFDTGNQGTEWPGDFEIVPHEPPLNWKAAKFVLNGQTNAPWIRVHLRGARRLSESTRLRFRYRLTGTGHLRIALVNGATGEQWPASIEKPASRAWGEARVDFKIGVNAVADEIRFVIAKGSELLVDDLLLYEPGNR